MGMQVHAIASQSQAGLSVLPRVPRALQAGQVSAALATFGKVKAAGGGVGPGALRVLGQLAKANLTQQGPPNPKGLADLEAQLPPVEGLRQEEVDWLESSVPGGAGSRRLDVSVSGFYTSHSSYYVTTFLRTPLTSIACQVEHSRPSTVRPLAQPAGSSMQHAHLHAVLSSQHWHGDDASPVMHTWDLQARQR